VNLCEDTFIYMNVFYGLCGCPAVWQCAAVRAAVCGSAHDCVRAVRAIVCGSALGSVRQCAGQCVGFRQCGSVR
jgi:hypothetical protein